MSCCCVECLRRLVLVHLALAKPRFNESTYLKKFGELNNNLDRVNYVYRDLKKYNLLPNIVNEEKNDSWSQTVRHEGNEAFRDRNYEVALRLYSRSILLAKSAEMLALAYANRSATLYKLGRYQDSLMDIERAFKNNYPDNLKEKLIKRRTNAERMLSSAKPLHRYHEDTPEIATVGKHPTIESARNCIDIETSEELGKHIVATRDIQIGEILCVEKPFAFTVETDRLLHCHFCLELCYNPVPCDTCIVLCFCSESCKIQACSTFHKYECSILKTLLNCRIDYHDLVAVRVTVLAIESSSEVVHDDIYRSSRYKELKTLMTGIDKIPVKQLYRRALIAALVFHVFRESTSIFSCSNKRTLETQFKENVLLQLMIINLNRMPIYEMVMNEFNWKDQYFALGLYSFTSLFNHSCCPNVELIQYGPTTVLRTIGSIKKGQQCCISYGPTYWNSIHPQRHFILKKRYYFECKCRACENKWNRWGELFNLQILAFMSHREIDALIMKLDNSNDRCEEIKNKFLPGLIKQLERCERFEPSHRVFNLKKTIFACFKYFGNKRLA